MEYKFEEIAVEYQFMSCTTWMTGEKFTYEKLDKFVVKRSGNEYLFTVLGSENETINGEEINDSYRVILDYGKALYPLTLKVYSDGKLLDIQDVEAVRKQWGKKAEELNEYYGYAPVAMTISRQYGMVLSDGSFLDVLRNNMIYRLLFWHDSFVWEPVSVPHFPEPERKAFYWFGNKQVITEGSFHYEAIKMCDEGSGKMVGGEGILDLFYSSDGLPSEIKLWVKLEEKDKGYFFHEVVIKRKE